jgi:hypothetical protein
MGRPSTFTQAIADEICERLSKGEPLAAICRDDAKPHPTTFRRWCEADETLAIAYACAREDGFDAIALEALEIADETSHDTRKGKDGDEQPNTEWITRSRLRVDTRLKLLAKWDPKRYGDKTLIGSDPDNPLPASFAVNLVKSGDSAPD